MGVNSKCGVQIKRRRESHESCVFIVDFPACGCQKKSVVYETESRHAAVQNLLLMTKCSYATSIVKYLYIFSQFSSVIVVAFDRTCFDSEYKLCLCNQHSYLYIFSPFSSLTELAFDRICFASEHKLCLCNQYSYPFIFSQFSNCTCL